jgi:hypothetical protein
VSDHNQTVQHTWTCAYLIVIGLQYLRTPYVPTIFNGLQLEISKAAGSVVLVLVFYVAIGKCII